jgi:hypothetical protein
MHKITRNTDRMISTIYEYQRYIQLNTQFIRELEKEGGDTRRLRAEVAELERKIIELKLMCGYRY